MPNSIRSGGANPLIFIVAQLENLMENFKFPIVSKELLEELEKRFPDRLPTTEITVEELRYLQGRQMVLNLLRHQFDLQNKSILESDNVF